MSNLPTLSERYTKTKVRVLRDHKPTTLHNTKYKSRAVHAIQRVSSEM